MKVTNFSFVALSFLLSSCATMFGGSTYLAEVVVPGQEDASIYIDGKFAGNGHISFEQPRIERLRVTVQKPNCKPEYNDFGIEMRSAMAMLGTATIVGFVVDSFTGAIWRPELQRAYEERDPRIKRINYDHYKYSIFYDGCKTKY
jgi:hypothetical protein